MSEQETQIRCLYCGAFYIRREYISREFETHDLVMIHKGQWNNPSHEVVWVKKEPSK